MNRKKENKTILIFSPAFAAGEADTTWLPSLQTFVRALNKSFPDLHVVVFAFQYPHTTKLYYWHNNLVLPFNGFYKKKFARLLTWLNILSSVRKLKKTHKLVGILSLWCTECTFVAKYATRLFKLPYFCWVLGQDARATNTYVKRIRPNPSSLITISDFLVEEFYRNHEIEPRHLVPMGIDISLFGPVPKKDIDVIGVGSLSRLKRYDLFVEMVAKLKENMPGINAMLCGDGEDRKRIEEMVKQLSVQPNLTLSGHIAYTEGLKMMQRAKILLHPSSYEGFGMVCLEALYAGAHVISFTQPMHHGIKHWHVVKTEEEMQNKAWELLNDPTTNYEPILVYSMQDSAKAIMNLFGYSSEPMVDNKPTAFSKTNVGE